MFLALVNVAHEETLRLDCGENEHENVTWWKDGQRLINSTGRLYSRERAQLSDGGDYFCNNSNATHRFFIRVGGKVCIIVVKGFVSSLVVNDMSDYVFVVV